MLAQGLPPQPPPPPPLAGPHGAELAGWLRPGLFSLGFPVTMQRLEDWGWRRGWAQGPPTAVQTLHLPYFSLGETLNQ